MEKGLEWNGSCPKWALLKRSVQEKSSLNGSGAVLCGRSWKSKEMEQSMQGAPVWYGEKQGDPYIGAGQSIQGAPGWYGASQNEFESEVGQSIQGAPVCYDEKQ